MKPILQKAQAKHTHELCELVNLAYRGNLGWTKETHLIAGQRTTPEEVKRYLSNPDTHLFIVVNNDKIIASICIEAKKECAYFGFFAVHPNLQGSGLGKMVLELAETFVIQNLKLKKIAMVVISQRKELISFYERRGYLKTKNIEAYPTHLNTGKPLKSGLTITYLEKNSI